MKTDTKERILKYIKENEPVRAIELVNHFKISNQAVQKHLNKLFFEEKIYKNGTAPKVFYFFQKEISKELVNLKDDFLKENFINFLANGEVQRGEIGFINWCKKRDLDIEKEVKNYKATIEKYGKFKDENGFIDGIEKMKGSFQEVYLDKVFYLDFYSIEKYGKTLLGNLLLYGKQTADFEIIEEILEKVKNPILDLIKKEKIDSVAFIPPSIDRKIQLMNELEKGLDLDLKKLELVKIFKDKVVSQKSLNKKEDRIQNARETIFILSKNFKSNRILLIDDAVGSGATLNETAKKIKERKIAKEVIGLALVGSFKGFEVINEV